MPQTFVRLYQKSEFGKGLYKPISGLESAHRMRWKYAARLAAAALVFTSILANLARYALLLRDHYHGSDFRLYYAAAQVGLTKGWQNIYDPSSQSSAIAAIGGPYKPFLNPPPMA